MKNRFHIIHDIPNRIRLIVPALTGRKDYADIYKLFTQVKGIHKVRIEPIINSIVIEYNAEVIERNTVLRYISIFFYQNNHSPIDHILPHMKSDIKESLFYSLVTGALLLVSVVRKKTNSAPDMLDYLTMISSAYTVLTHGGKDKLKHPDVIAGIISMVSLGPNNITKASAISWGINLLEVLLDLARQKYCEYCQSQSLSNFNIK